MERPERNAWIPSIRAYPWEREIVAEAAAQERVSVSEYIRTTLVASARRRVGRKGESRTEAVAATGAS